MCEVNEYNNINDILIKTKLNPDLIRFENISDTKLIVYNLSTYSPLQKCWIYVDRCKIVKKMIGGILIGFSLKNQAIELINNLELTIKDKYKSTLKYNQSINSNDINIPTLELTIDDDTRYFTHSNELINYFDDNLIAHNYSKRNIKEIGLIIELDYIESDNDKLLYYWRVVQLKENKKIDINISIFKTLDDSNIQQRKQIHIPINPKLNHISNNNSEPILPPYIPPDKRKTNETQPISNTGIRPILSANELQNVLGSLKPVNKPKIINQNNSDNQELQEITQLKDELKHTETREKSPIELYNLEKENNKMFSGSKQDNNDDNNDDNNSQEFIDKTKYKKSKKSKKSKIIED